jgi:hypothetical protein
MIIGGGSGAIPTPTNFTSRVSASADYNWSDNLYPTSGTATGTISVSYSVGNWTGALIEILGSGTLGAAANRTIWGQANASSRWSILLGDNTAETGSNAGSNFAINSFTDGGAALATPLSITRSSGAVAHAGTNTNDSAAAGFVGEFLSTQVTSGVSLSTGTAANIGTLSLTAGDWDVSGTVVFTPNASTTVSSLAAGVSPTSATLPTPTQINTGLGTMSQQPQTFTTGAQAVLSGSTIRVSISATTSYYLVAQSTFATSTMTATGIIGARRRR